MKPCLNVPLRALLIALAVSALPACSRSTFISLPAYSPSSADQSVTASTDLHWGGSYLFTNDQKAIYPVLQQTATSKTQVTQPIANNVARVGSIIGAPENTVLFAPSLAHMTRISDEHAPSDIYDIEHWSRTPLAERDNPADSIADAAGIAHKAGKRFGITPDGEYMGISRCSFSLTRSIIPVLNWSQIDILNIQAQHLISNSSCALKFGTSAYRSMVEKIASYVRRRNPRIVIWAEVSLRDSNPSTIIRAAQSVFGIVHGMNVSYPSSSDFMNCRYCTPANLETVLRSV